MKILRFGREIIDKFFLLHNYAELLHNISLTTSRRKKIKPKPFVFVNTQWSLLPPAINDNQLNGQIEIKMNAESDNPEEAPILTVIKNDFIKKLSVPNTIKFFENCPCGKNEFEHAVDHFYVTLKSLDNTFTNPNTFICPKLDWIKCFLFVKCIESKEIQGDYRKYNRNADWQPLEAGRLNAGLVD